MFLSRGPWGHGFGWFAFLTITQLYCPSSQPTRGVAPAPHLLQPRFSPFPVLSSVPTTSKGGNLSSPFIRTLTSWILSLLWYYSFILQHSATFVCQKDAVSNSKFPVFLTQCYIHLLIFLNLLFFCHVLKGLWALVVEGYMWHLCFPRTWHLASRIWQRMLIPRLYDSKLWCWKFWKVALATPVKWVIRGQSLDPDSPNTAGSVTCSQRAN